MRIVLLFCELEQDLILDVFLGFQGYPPKGATEDFRIKGLSGVNLLTKQENLSHAQRVFCDLLGGEMHQPSSFPVLVPSRFYVFTWPDSPLNIAINIEVGRY